ncbi:MAG: FimV/HubP family polar landmark protein, partial [Usitatibacteraceae bacterium]
SDTVSGFTSLAILLSVSLEQMLVALYRENKDAFAGGNMNRLRTGQILRVPSAGDVANISATEARAEIKVQVANWNAYREQVAGSVSTAPVKAASNAASGKITVATPDAPAPAAASKDQLKKSKDSRCRLIRKLPPSRMTKQRRKLILKRRRS